MSNSSPEQLKSIAISFHGAELYLIEQNGQPYTPMKPIVEGMGLAWQPQHRKLAGNEARWGITIMVIPLQGGSESETPLGGVQKMLAMPLRKLPGWLATIDPGRVKSEVARARVIQYQNECDDVLWQYWNDGFAINPRAYSTRSSDMLTQDQQTQLRSFLENAAARLPADKRGAFLQSGWGKLKRHTSVSYRQIPQSDHIDALSLLARHAAEWEVVDDVPKPVPMSALLPEAQAKEIEVRLKRLGWLFHPTSQQFQDVNGILRALRGLDPRFGSETPGYRQLLKRVDDSALLSARGALA